MTLPTQVWDMKSEDSNAVLTLAGHSGTVRCLNLNGNRLVSGSVDRSIKVRLTQVETLLTHLHGYCKMCWGVFQVCAVILST